MQTAAVSSEGDVLTSEELEAAVSRLDLDWEGQQEQFEVSGYLLHFLFRPPAKNSYDSFPAHEGQWLAYGMLGGILGLIFSLMAVMCGAICWLFVGQGLLMVMCSIYGASRAKAYRRAAADYQRSRGLLTARVGDFKAACRK